MSTRAVHLELVKTMSPNDFVLAMLRFINRFGAPKEIISDNAKTFLSGSSLLSDIYLTDLYKENLSKFNIDFKTIPVYSPWYGAIYERLIAVVKILYIQESAAKGSFVRVLPYPFN